ncbi:alkaline serine protease AorO, putative [Talaromyces stipitatus ATCC 10500]|uniref:Alkaline serine protease AorO, putative n=1 Tax=Talaromyces stipitatus (strain ATCC 10500 / CBS 375.48 / QM 6759 / NRRL 1006) TaxID=441959 RepID=B8MU45_TALSN|nr:alkaline serine protease AorO, putative [Talaromyces stipitatus ATCC 10500]EED12678.1 alkaline serine protease AorO, putative [Talaromyces stipitatus ATCC 10500]
MSGKSFAMKSSILLLSLAAATTLAAPAPSKSHIVHERRGVLPASWVEPRRVDGQAKLPVRIGLTQSNSDVGHDLLMDVSNPYSPNYRKYLTVHEVNDLFAPAESAVSAVRNWLEGAGIASDRVSQSTNKQWLQFDGDAEELERLLGTEYYIYTHASSGRTHLGCEEYHIPKHLSEHIDYITPGVKTLEVRDARPAELKKRSFGLQNPIPPLLKDLPETIETIIEQLFSSTLCDSVITPDCIRTMYNITEGTTATKGNELGIFEDLGDYYAQKDLDLFFTTVYPKIPIGTSPTLKGIDGGSAPTTLTNAGPESDLDFQISYPIIWPQNAVLFQTDDANYEANYTFNGFLNNLLDAIDGSYCTFSDYGITGNTDDDPSYPDSASNGYKGSLQCGVYKPTNVISISYGGDEYGLSANYQKRQCDEFKKLGLQGVSVVVSSGDSGVAGSDGCLGDDGTIFNPDFPSGCPYITTVGATYLPSGTSPNGDNEVAVSRFPSGGGFSNIYPQPSYQAEAVNTYLTKHTPPYKSYNTSDNTDIGANGGIYNAGGRGYPDVAAVGDNVLIYNAGRPTLIGGTSASAPAWGAILTRINEELLVKKGTTVGFVNPILYAHPEVFHDITSGNNPGCGTDGFETAPGWDPVTGLGTPNYPALLALFLGE